MERELSDWGTLVLVPISPTLLEIPQLPNYDTATQAAKPDQLSLSLTGSKD